MRLRTAKKESQFLIPPGAIHGYLRFRRGTGLSSATLALDRYILLPFAAKHPSWCEDFRGAAVDFLESSRTAWTRLTRLRVLRLFVRYLQEEEGLEGDPLRGVKAAIPAKKATAPTPEDVQRFLGALGTSWEHTRLRALIYLLADTGLRRGEGVRLQWTDYNPSTRALRVRAETSKVRRERTVPVTPQLARALRQYRKSIPEAFQDSPWIFPLTPEEPISPAAVGLMVRRIAQKAGLKFHLHGLRHLAATELIRSTGNISLAAQLLGHTKISTTSEFYEHLTLDDVREGVESAGVLRGLLRGKGAAS